MQLRQQTITRNTLKNVVVLASDPKGTIQIEWQPAGDPNGGDMQIIPDEIVSLPQFTRLVLRGAIVVESADADVSEILERQQAAFDSRMSGAAAKAEESIDREEQKDLLQVPCIGPDARGIGECGNPVPVREKTKDDVPALCSTHSGLAGQYVQHEVQDGTQVVKKWSRVQITPRERQQA